MPALARSWAFQRDPAITRSSLWALSRPRAEKAVFSKKIKPILRLPQCWLLVKVKSLPSEWITVVSEWKVGLTEFWYCAWFCCHSLIAGASSGYLMPSTPGACSSFTEAWLFLVAERATFKPKTPQPWNSESCQAIPSRPSGWLFAKSTIVNQSRLIVQKIGWKLYDA